ncbi:molybdenum ABC transporter ATP-binding protein [Candidatus Bathyarchaeota archaeon]|nr:MAG: molybdenum ABC transporter ATP-binding protein [Candidatus Bathyarchaeota archaeon]
MIRVEGLRVMAGDFKLRVEELDVERGEYLTLMGPSGAGKTIFLETLVGFRRPEAGSIYIDGRDITDLPPEKRGLAYVPQSIALWPHMTVYENIAYGLRIRGTRESELRRRVLKVAEYIGIEGLLKRMPETLSGGEKQRVALARALIIKPQALLLDEPLSSLDEASRESAKELIKRLHRELGFTAIHVTHDPVEAAELGKRMAVMYGGEIIQVGRPMEVFRDPKSMEVAWLSGRPNILEGIVKRCEGGVQLIDVEGVELKAAHPKPLPTGRRVILLLGREDIVLSRAPLRSSMRNQLHCRVAGVEELGPLIEVELMRGGVSLRVLITRGSYEELNPKPGEMLYAGFKATAVKVLPST